MITEEEILLSIPNLYDLNWWPKDDFENIQGFNMKSSDEEFADALKEVTDYLGKQTKGNIFKIGRSKFKIKKTDLRRKEINIVIDDSIYGEGDAEIKWWCTGRGGKVNCTLQVSSKSGAYASHLKTMLQAIKFLMDGTLEKGFTKTMLESFILKRGPKAKEECSDCGYSYKTPLGEAIHKCDLLKAGYPSCPTCNEVLTSQENLKIHIEKVHAEGDAPEPMELAKSSQVDVDQMLSDLLNKVTATKALIQPPEPAKETLPAPKNVEITVRKYLGKNFPGSVIKVVKGDGACLVRALSYILWQTEGHYKTIAKAICKYILANLKMLEESNEIYYPLTRKLRGKEITFQNRDEFQSFLKSDESVYAWREGTDLQIISTLFKIQIVIGVFYFTIKEEQATCQLILLVSEIPFQQFQSKNGI